MTTIVLASASPRRRDLFSKLGLPFEVRPVNITEDVPDGVRPDVTVRKLARIKAESARLRDSQATIVAADTVVVLDGRILGKPGDPDEAREMLRALRDRWHKVITAVAFLPERKSSPLIRHPVTAVRMRNYSDDEIDASITRGDPFDKAGAYGIQDPVLQPVASYETEPGGVRGCYCNVVGLSLWVTMEMLRKVGVAVDARVEQLLPQCADCPLALI
ncbi:MAG: septum formation protein Maf [Chloroflexi bacterium]|nr:septum formation protein Maf [Chloroflexota bacterium]